MRGFLGAKDLRSKILSALTGRRQSLKKSYPASASSRSINPRGPIFEVKQTAPRSKGTTARG